MIGILTFIAIIEVNAFLIIPPNKSTSNDLSIPPALSKY